MRPAEGGGPPITLLASTLSMMPAKEKKERAKPDGELRGHPGNRTKQERKRKPRRRMNSIRSLSEKLPSTLERMHLPSVMLRR